MSHDPNNPALGPFLLQCSLLFSAKTLFDGYSAKGRWLRPKNVVETLLFSSAVPGFALLYKVLLRFLRNRCGAGRGHLAPFVAGCISSLCLLLDPSVKRRRFIAAMMFMRILHHSVRAFVTYPHILEDRASRTPDSAGQTAHRSLTLSRLVHRWGDWALWYYASMHTNYCVFLYPHLLPTSYAKSLFFVSGIKARLGKDYMDIMRGYQTLVLGLDAQPAHALNQPLSLVSSTKSFLTPLLNQSPRDPLLVDRGWDALNLHVLTTSLHPRLGCAVIHPHQSTCLSGALSSFQEVAAINLKTYLLLNSPSLLLAMYRKPQKYPSHVKKYVMGTAKSLAFVASYISVISYCICLCRTVLPGREKKFSYAMSVWVACLAILLDKPGRITELTTYGLMNCFGSWVKIMHVRAGMPRLDAGTEFSCMIPLWGLLAWIRENRPEAITGLLTPFVTRLF
ncbi:hypothetical protein HDV03_003088 [Kappamyces sp. JEL0829]|nr:hypothetical protein HDV03_003088 [Kappamyces sp. JEL0829]